MNQLEPNHNLTEHDLLALNLGELPPERAHALMRAVAGNPAMAAESAAIATMLSQLKGLDMPLDAGLLDRSWKALRPSLVAHSRPAARFAHWRMPAFAGLALASAGLIGYVAYVSRTPAVLVPAAPVAGVPAVQGDGVRQEPGSTDAPLRVPSGAGWKVQLGAGVYHPHGGRGESPIRMLGLATTAHGLNEIPVRPRFQESASAATAPSSMPERAALRSGSGPLTEVPVGPGLGNPASLSKTQSGVAGGASTGASGHKAGGRHGSRFETTLSLGVSGQFTAQRAVRNQDGDDLGYQQMNKADGIVGTVGQSFRPWLGYTVNFGYARTLEQNVGYAGTSGETFPIPLNAYELSVAYTVRKRVKPKLTAIASVGGGALTFLPVHRGATAKEYVPFQSTSLVPPVSFRPLGVATAGVEYHFKPHVGLRVEYRGLLYKMPDFGELVGKAMTVTSEPVVSVTYSFGGR